jgi:pimeloyl-ACP methyl ester carboxylesterase
MCQAGRGPTVARMNWELIETGPSDASRTVLLLPGGMCSARSWAEVTAHPALAGIRLLAVTLPGQAGSPAPDDFSVEHYARITAELAKAQGADVVVGFSMGATIAYEMVVSGAFTGPVVLLGVSLSAPSEPAFFRGIIRLGSLLGSLPSRVLAKGAAAMVKHAELPPERRAALAADFARNNPRDVQRSLQAYLRWLHRDDDPARRLCSTRVPVWIVHADKGDGGLTSHERDVLTGCPHAHVVTVPGQVFFLPNEVPERVAKVTLEALAAS